MLTGAGRSRPTPSRLSAAILEREPDWQALPPSATPVAVRTWWRDASRRIAARRLHSSPTRESRLTVGTHNQPAPDASNPVRRRALFASVAGLVLAGVVVGWVGRLLSRSGSAPPPLSLMLETLPEDRTFMPGGNESGSMVALSPNGTRLVYAAREGAEQRLFSRSLDRLDQLSSSPMGRIPRPRAVLFPRRRVDRSLRRSIAEESVRERRPG